MSWHTVSSIRIFSVGSIIIDRSISISAMKIPKNVMIVHFRQPVNVQNLSFILNLVLSHEPLL